MPMTSALSRARSRHQPIASMALIADSQKPSVTVTQPTPAARSCSSTERSKCPHCKPSISIETISLTGGSGLLAEEKLKIGIVVVAAVHAPLRVDHDGPGMAARFDRVGRQYLARAVIAAAPEL